jgi:hypothetical protein
MSVTEGKLNIVKNSIYNLQHSPTSSVFGTFSSRHSKADLVIITKGTKKDECKHFTTALKNQIKIMYLKGKFTESSK